ncbi:MAG TPA: hypothetical protein DD420_12005 [Streptomyces sp.]|nr:hypothetical protein [Streptomyces sp.]
MSAGPLNMAALRDLLTSLPPPRFDGRIVLTVDVSPWLRSDAACSPEGLFFLVHGRNGPRIGPHGAGPAVLVRRRAHPEPHLVDADCGWLGAA